MVTRWGADKDVGMSYSYMGVNATGDDYDAIAEPVLDTIYFAGEVSPSPLASTGPEPVQ